MASVALGSEYMWSSQPVIETGLTTDVSNPAWDVTGSVLLTGAANASRAARSFTVASNWNPNAYVKYYATFERTTFDGGLPSRLVENVILFRAQIGF
jgi:hypothetical protein